MQNFMLLPMIHVLNTLQSWVLQTLLLQSVIMQSVILKSNGISDVSCFLVFYVRKYQLFIWNFKIYFVEIPFMNNFLTKSWIVKILSIPEKKPNKFIKILLISSLLNKGKFRQMFW